MGKASKDKRDAYYRLAKEQNWRARSAFKLIQIDEQFDLFAHADPDSVTRVVDLCAAPGSWSQVLSRVLIKGESFGRRAWLEKRRRDKKALEKVGKESENTQEGEQDDDDTEDESIILKPRKNVKIVAIDLQPMAPLEGITMMKADITHPSTIPLLLRALDPEYYEEGSEKRDTPQSNTTTSTKLPSRHPHPVDLVISDGAPDVTGLHDLDIYIQSQLLYAALNLTIGVLRPGGKFVAKIFRGRDVDLLYAQLRTVFEKVSVAKPRSSRASSLEAFVVCEGFMPPEDFDSTHALQNPMFGGAAVSKETNEDGTVGYDIPDDDEKPQQSRIAQYVPATANGDALDQLTLAEQLSHPPPHESRWIPPFIACGDLSAWDADASYALPEGYVSLDPVQPPTAPPYKRALEMRKELGGTYGKTKLGATGRA
ncbi:tRNA methyltransferase, putative [Talaromyces stipitatus ATCC 10500]|uniref:Putative tRNA (cytidine(32)/guanosine(34)-2'-O)-methyltransferase n=1 Tax=Talaromyces stipitatus (strain ATCC 10500 / CBS 375.48 / QM 6759 / NRRL 1006) TaxID=441959 RepID=B8LYR3_TALSN|nr:tRNA methyltransferase, putative [Talaromyces stipitatus ATCC 10500]EED23421.1 tRNA methyltransferase, putative [Talaromyces stipitatus ATCC 10500]